MKLAENVDFWLIWLLFSAIFLPLMLAEVQWSPLRTKMFGILATLWFTGWLSLFVVVALRVL